MKKASIILGFTFLLIFLSSCLTTLHPIFTEKDLAYDPKLIGVWNAEREGNKERVTISNLAIENSVELPGNISHIKQKGYLISYEHEHSEILIGILLFFPASASIYILIITLQIKKRTNTSTNSSERTL
jgi:hypothetical protein